MMGQEAYLILENEMMFCGRLFGAEREVTGELVFTTAMTGYLETLTDPSYYGQIVLQTFPLIGNYGVIPSDFENEKPHLTAYIVRDWCQEPSNFRCEGTLDAFLKQHGIPGISGVDTRQLTRIIRESGTLNAAILLKKPENVRELAEKLRNFRVIGAVEAVENAEVERYSHSHKKHRVVLWDFGAKRNIIRELMNRDCEVICVPFRTSCEEILALNPDGIMLSNGPGDPQENTGVIEEMTKLMQAKLPTFGICLGHQLLALSQGAKTAKLKYGHRGANQPVRETESGKVYISSQNHGYAVLADTLPANACESFQNGNDGTNEGVAYTDMPAFSVQFHPEACGGPHDTTFLFDRFIQMIEEHKAAR